MQVVKKLLYLNKLNVNTKKIIAYDVYILVKIYSSSKRAN